MCLERTAPFSVDGDVGMAQESPWMPVPHQHRSLRAPLDSISCSDGSFLDMCMDMDGTGIAHVAPSPGALMVDRVLHTWRTGERSWIAFFWKKPSGATAG